LIPTASILGNRPEYLLEWDVFGAVFRFATSSVSVTDAAGRALRFVVGLEPVAASPDGEPVAVTVSPGAGPDWAKLRARGIMLEGTRATVRRWYIGQTLESAPIVAIGWVYDVEYGSLEQPITFSVARVTPIVEPSSLYPPASACFSEDTWPVQNSAIWARVQDFDNVPYPTVIGKPGGTGNPPAAPAYIGEEAWEYVALYQSSKLVICRGEVVATSVTVIDVSELRSESGFTVQYTADNLGEKVAYVDFTGSDWVIPNPEHEYAVDWGDGAGGIYNLERTECLRKLGDLLCWVLATQTRQRVDLQAQYAQRDLLNGFKVDTCIAERVDLIEWVERNLMPLFPIRKVISDRGGVYFEANRYALGTPGAEGVLDADAGRVVRLGGVRTKTPADGIANHIRLRFGIDVAGRVWYSRAISGDPSDDTTVTPNLLCKWSQTLLAVDGSDGVRATEIDADCIWDKATAELCLQSLARLRALPREIVAYEGGLELERYRVGDALRIVDSEIYLDHRIAYVAEPPRVEGATVALLLELEPDPTQVARRTT
jgi:hypothetical protein